MKDMQTEQLLCWSGMTDTEHSVTSGSNEDEEGSTSLWRNRFGMAHFVVALFVIAHFVSGPFWSGPFWCKFHKNNFFFCFLPFPIFQFLKLFFPSFFFMYFFKNSRRFFVHFKKFLSTLHKKYKFKQIRLIHEFSMKLYLL